MLPEILAKAEMMDRITTDSGLMLVSLVLVSFEGLSPNSVQFTTEVMTIGVCYVDCSVKKVKIT